MTCYCTFAAFVVATSAVVDILQEFVLDLCEILDAATLMVVIYETLLKF